MGEAIIGGEVAAGFESVKEAFKANFALGLEVGAACSVYLKGQKVVDLWGGFKDPDHTDPWAEDTIVNMMSVAKGVSALCIHRLVEQGKLDLDAPIAKYWPGFDANGKENVLVRHALDHRAGLPYLTADLPAGTAFDWDRMTQALAAQATVFEPGTQPAYHTLTMSYLLGQLVRNVTGGTIGEYFRREISAPLGLDYNLSIPFDDYARCARFIMWKGYSSDVDGEADPPTELLKKAWAQLPADADDEFNGPSFRSGDFCAGNGHGTARGVAELYDILCDGGQRRGVHVLSPATLAKATEMQWFDTEPVLTHNYRMALGFTLNSPDAFMGPNAEAFGHVGAGGATGFGDPVAGVGFCYAMNQMYPTRDNGPRARRLIEATYASIGGLEG